MTRQSAALLAGLIISAISLQGQAAEMVNVYKTSRCECCSKWVAHLEGAGFEVRTHTVLDMAAARQYLGMPERFGACHTAKVAGYLIEGHVPAADILRVLKEKPKAIGLAVPAMPPGSTGMEGVESVPYDTFLVKAFGATEIFARH